MGLQPEVCIKFEWGMKYFLNIKCLFDVRLDSTTTQYYINQLTMLLAPFKVDASSLLLHRRRNYRPLNFIAAFSSSFPFFLTQRGQNAISSIRYLRSSSPYSTTSTFPFQLQPAHFTSHFFYFQLPFFLCFCAYVSLQCFATDFQPTYFGLESESASVLQNETDSCWIAGSSSSVWIFIGHQWRPERAEFDAVDRIDR